MPDVRPPAVVAVVGTRNYPDARERVLDRVRSLTTDWPQFQWIVVSGGGGQVDKAAEYAAATLKLPMIVYPADWETHGKAAGPLRNQQIVNEVPEAGRDNPSRVVAFWDMTSRGTRDTIRKAILNNRAVEIWDTEYEPAGHEGARMVFGG